MAIATIGNAWSFAVSRSPILSARSVDSSPCLTQVSLDAPSTARVFLQSNHPICRLGRRAIRNHLNASILLQIPDRARAPDRGRLDPIHTSKPGYAPRAGGHRDEPRRRERGSFAVLKSWGRGES